MQKYNEEIGGNIVIMDSIPIANSVASETTVYLDRPSKHYLPLSDEFANKEYFFFIIQMIQF